MPAILDQTGSVTVRINVDRNNAHEAKQVVQLFKQHGVIDPRLDFRLGYLNTSRGIVDCIPHDCHTPQEFGNLEQDFRTFLAAEGFTVFGKLEPIKYPCTAALHNSFIFDSKGQIGKCVPAVGTTQSVFARIYPGELARTLAEVRSSRLPYGTFDPFIAATCRGCKLLPACLGSCPKMHEPGGNFQCSNRINLDDKLLFYDEFWSPGTSRHSAGPRMPLPLPD
jgi:uncharacterized protein